MNNFKKINKVNELKEGKSSNARYTKDEIKIIFDYVDEHLSFDSSLDCVKELALKATDENILEGRNYNAFELMLERCFTVLNGVLPYGESKSRAEQFLVPNKIIFEVHDEYFMDKISAEQKLQNAIGLMEKRIISEKITREMAKLKMSNYYKSIKETLNEKSKKLLSSNQETIISELMKGLPENKIFDEILS